jgi:hypothetical protein
MTLQNALFGKISSREMAVDLAKWCGDGYFMLAALLTFFFVLIASNILFVVLATFLALCGYFTRFKANRIAVIMGVLLALCGFVLTAIVPPHEGGIAFAFAAWMGIRGSQAIFKLRGKLADEPPSTLARP